MSQIPQPPGLPVFGNLLGFMKKRPEYLLQQAIRYGKIVQFSFGGIRAVLIADPELVQDVLVRRKDDFVKDVNLTAR